MKNLEEMSDATNRLAVANGLMLAHIMVRRRFLDAFDKGSGATELVSLIASDISTAMKKISLGEDLTKIL